MTIVKKPVHVITNLPNANKQFAKAVAIKLGVTALIIGVVAVAVSKIDTDTDNETTED